MEKQNGAYLYKQMLFGNKNKWNTDVCYNLDELWKQYTNWKKWASKDQLLCDSIKCLVQVTYRDRKGVIGGCLKLGRRQVGGKMGSDS